MASAHTPADDIVYDLVSVQYHALKAAERYDRYLQDAEDHDDVRVSFEEIKAQDAERAVRCHQLLRTVTQDHGIG